MLKMVFKYVHPIRRLSNEMLSKRGFYSDDFVLILSCRDEKRSG